ncbi:hypothetical protein Clacol_002559 [Clathrus columnatus]|uniref:Protein arginine methyltransferase NDUFAF7 n=1 Tax=Clathrus columnatus TaxID=1419009 RepID=A0AAV5A574_9AGAM|nr:hypothetical protein Clacol_002559 [Clathrus columnatus]
MNISKSCLLRLTRKNQLHFQTKTVSCINRCIHHDGGRMTPIEKIVFDSIKASGPIPVSTYMQLCLSHPEEGYYTKMREGTKDIFGKNGDFITSPEISQVFGEMISLWLLSMWNQPDVNGQFTTFRVLELGPGRGTMISDLVHTYSNWPSVINAMTGIHLVETSSFMRLLQAKNIQFPKDKLHWYDSIEDIPPAADNEFTMVIAHEFFDALPISILQEGRYSNHSLITTLVKNPNGYREILVDLVEKPVGQSPQQNLKFVVSQEQTLRSEFLARLSNRYSNLPDGTRIEVSAAAWRIAHKIGEIVGRSKQDTSEIPKGAALVIDYGDEHVFNGSFRAFKKHGITNVFDQPGYCDLTANVDFTLLKEAARDVAKTYGTIDQATFLTRMGISLRLERMLQHVTDHARRLELQKAVGRLIDTSGQGMGGVYKVMGISGWPERKEEVWPFIPLEKTENRPQ